MLGRADLVKEVGTTESTVFPTFEEKNHECLPGLENSVINPILSLVTSVASVTSVRCFPFSLFSHRKTPCPPSAFPVFTTTVQNVSR
jgi:hypothetical protein